MKVVVASSSPRLWHIVCPGTHYTPGASLGSEIRDLLRSQHRPRARSNCINNTFDKVAHQLHFWHITRKKTGLKISWSILFPVPSGDKTTSCLADSANKNRRSENKHLYCRSCFLPARWIVAISMFILFPEYLCVYYCGHLAWAPITQAVALCLAPVSFCPQRLLWCVTGLETGAGMMLWHADMQTLQPSPDAWLPVLQPWSPHNRHDRQERGWNHIFFQIWNFLVYSQSLLPW